MYIEDCLKKDLFGTFERAKLPTNILEYNCELCIQEYAEGPVSEEVKYFLFTPKAGVKAQPFKIMIDNINKPKTLIYQYKIHEKEQDSTFTFGDRLHYKMQTSVIEPPKKESYIQNLPEPDSDGEFFFRDIDESRLNENLLRLQQGSEDDNYSGDSKCVQPSEGEKGKIKSELIEFLHEQGNRFSKIKDIRNYLQSKGFRISDYQVKQLLGEICKTSISDRKSGFLLKDIYVNREEYERRNPKKKIKDQ